MLPRLDAWNRARASMAEVYLGVLQSHGSISIPTVPAWAEPAWHLFVLGLPDRDSCARSLAERGIETLVHYPVLPHRTGPYRDHWPLGSFPVAERLACSALSLPLHPQLDPAACEFVADAMLATVAPSPSA
jgi:dTDP-4-amino-4,6-dideoxygalactose transaminase